MRDPVYQTQTYSPTVQPPKRKPTRAAQACDSCRTLKAKCDEQRPCSSCKEKNTQCVYRDPPPKQYDKTTSDILEGLMRIEKTMGTLYSKISRVEKALIANVPQAEAALKEEPQEGALDEVVVPTAPIAEYAPRPSISSDTQIPLASASPYSVTTAQPQRLLERTEPEEETEDEEDGGDPIPPGQPSIPVNHTTGAARLLLVAPIAEMAKDVIRTEKIKNEKYPMIQEERRGLIRLFGKGEGLDLAQGYDKDPLNDHGSDTTPSDSHSEVSSPAGEEWGQLGGLTPPGSGGVIEVRRGGISQDGMPPLDRETVLDLVKSYMENMNIMHPILIPRRVDALVESFLKSIPESQPKHKSVSALFAANPDSPGQKRKRSPGLGEQFEGGIKVSDYKPGHPFRSISTALVLLILALGKICRHTSRIPDVVPDREHDAYSSPHARNGHVSSSLQSSPIMSTASSGLPSPQDGGERLYPRSRPSSVEPYARTPLEGVSGYPQRTSSKLKNLDVIPGLAYFALATDIIGNQIGGNSLQHVHVNILAGLYHGQLARVLESHAYIHQACRSLQVILRPKLERFRRLKQSMHAVPVKDNPLIFAFWTCLQLESDIVAELPCPHSGILTFEDDMPGPNLQAAANIDQIHPRVLESYAAQLFLRKHLNQLHNMFYKPDDGSQFPLVFSGNNRTHFPTIQAVEESLKSMNVYAPNMGWNEEDPPADEILGARLRAKYYGAQVITYRNFLLKILEHSAAKKNSVPSQQVSSDFKHGIVVPKISTDEIPAQVLEYAKSCIQALVKSTTAFHGLPQDKRLIVTNVWGTAHAQWGNMLTLQAVYCDPILKEFIDPKLLASLLRKTIRFLRQVAQPSSALWTDIKILEHTGIKNGLLSPKGTDESMTSSFSGDVPMAEH
ncbi:hypothetical protein F5884DRAFT_661141 [Xylogone sp. PMI_703]|nr:hypothetical protein F5884DRAFT_661141 [Xylogone sp. PMI_703]